MIASLAVTTGRNRPRIPTSPLASTRTAAASSTVSRSPEPRSAQRQVPKRIRHAGGGSHRVVGRPDDVEGHRLVVEGAPLEQVGERVLEGLLDGDPAGHREDFDGSVGVK